MKLSTRRLLATYLAITALTVSSCGSAATAPLAQEQGSSAARTERAPNPQPTPLLAEPTVPDTPKPDLAESLCDSLDGASVARLFGVEHLGPAVVDYDKGTGSGACSYWWLFPGGSKDVILGEKTNNPGGELGKFGFSVHTFAEGVSGYGPPIPSATDMLSTGKEYFFETAYRPSQNLEFASVGLGGFCYDNHTCFAALDDRVFARVVLTMDSSEVSQEALIRVLQQLEAAAKTLS